ncbi:MGDG synthase family glycosyltransferase [Fredinandcohnia humi]
MKKILVFPLLDSLPSGHHQVANAVIKYVYTRSTTIECKKIDLLRSWNSQVESLVTKIYLSWIQKFPKSYAFVYKTLAYKSKKHRSYKHYDLLFQNKMKRIISIENPDLIICTHAFPSYLLNNLKKSGACDVPVLNIYTDFFMNDVWGKEMIEYHFVSDRKMKSSLMTTYDISERNIFVTGIPVDESFSNSLYVKKNENQITILLSGGSAGLGNIMELLINARHEKRLRFFVLCGNNKQLYEEISNLNDRNIYPLPYISSRKEMNDLYNLADAIITKPGGVTISEAIKKKVPIFVISALPGQEEINLKNLKEQGLVFTIREGINLADQLLRVLTNKVKMLEYERSLRRYLNTRELHDSEEIFNFIDSLLCSSEKRRRTEVVINNQHKPMEI